MVSSLPGPVYATQYLQPPLFLPPNSIDNKSTDVDGLGVNADAPLKLGEFLPYRLHLAALLLSNAFLDVLSRRYRLDEPEWRTLMMLGQSGPMVRSCEAATNEAAQDRVGDRACQSFAVDQRLGLSTRNVLLLIGLQSLRAPRSCIRALNSVARLNGGFWDNRGVCRRNVPVHR